MNPDGTLTDEELKELHRFVTLNVLAHPIKRNHNMVKFFEHVGRALDELVWRRGKEKP